MKNSKKSEFFTVPQERFLFWLCIFLIVVWAAGIALFLAEHPAIWQMIVDKFVSIRIGVAVALFNAGLLF